MECALMDRDDLLEVISTWNSLYLSNHINYDIKHMDGCGNNWKKGLLKVASSLDVIDEIKGSPVELMLNKAIVYARRMDDGTIKEVNELLHTVENYMNEEENF
jgi:hypothetical protein